ncbi:hypothetical protein [Rugamonas sp.]|uniref:hypothetical protein n=1 Tax=Rugamonas sp. TaxID=1926287 RepID=UPI0025E4D659|nr:hypothetical protein [Rugamonas sp.]
MDPRDAIWDGTTKLLYNVNYAEKIEQALLARWTWMDSITKIAVAISSASAALAGLVFWKNPNYTFLWPLFTSASTLLAIVSKQLSVTDKVTQHATCAAELASLAVDIDSLMVRMRINAEFPIADYTKKLMVRMDKYRFIYSELKYDLLLTERVRARAQQKIDTQVADWH